MSEIEAPRGDTEPANRSSLPFRDARRSAAAASSSSDMSVIDDSDDDDQSWHSVWGSHGGGGGEIEAEMGHFVSDCSSEEVDLESGDLEVKVHLGKIERRDCRICHLEIEIGGVGGGRHNSSDAPIQLGCCCRGDLGTAHKQCAETWFKIKGNTICEICGATAENVASQQINEPSSAVPAAAAVASSGSIGSLTLVETRTIFHGRRIMNFLLACMLLAFAMSWLFHFKLMS